MIKKILIGLGALILIAVPFFVLAQFPKAELSNCCVLKHDSHDYDPVAGTGYKEGWAVGEPGIQAKGFCYAKGQKITANLHDEPDWGGYCTMDTIYTVTDFVFWIFTAVVIIMGVFTGVMFMTAGGNPAQIEKAKSMIMYLVIGVVVAIAVKLIPSFARAIIGL